MSVSNGERFTGSGLATWIFQVTAQQAGDGVFRVVTSVPPRRVACSGHIGADQPLAGFGDAWVLLVHFTRPTITAWSVLAYGQTTDLESPHSRDQIGLFANHELGPCGLLKTRLRHTWSDAIGQVLWCWSLRADDMSSLTHCQRDSAIRLQNRRAQTRSAHRRAALR